MKIFTGCLTVAVAAICLSTSAFADFISIDESGNGTGTKGTGFYAKDRGPGGLANELTYKLPFFVRPGDLELVDSNGVIQDIIRFNGRRVVYYFDIQEGLGASGVKNLEPKRFRKNHLIIPELGSGAVGFQSLNGTWYTPIKGEPGFNPKHTPTYFFGDSLSAVPEPSALILLGSGAALLAGLKFRRRSQHSA